MYLQQNFATEFKIQNKVSTAYCYRFMASESRGCSICSPASHSMGHHRQGRVARRFYDTWDRVQSSRQLSARNNSFSPVQDGGGPHTKLCCVHRVCTKMGSRHTSRENTAVEFLLQYIQVFLRYFRLFPGAFAKLQPVICDVRILHRTLTILNNT